MKKSNLERLAAEDIAWPPPLDEEARNRLTWVDGRSARRTGRNVKYGTVVRHEFREWMREQAKVRGRSHAELLEEMKAAFIEKYGN